MFLYESYKPYCNDLSKSYKLRKARVMEEFMVTEMARSLNVANNHQVYHQLLLKQGPIRLPQQNMVTIISEVRDRPTFFYLHKWRYRGAYSSYWMLMEDRKSFNHANGDYMRTESTPRHFNIGINATAPNSYYNQKSSTALVEDLAREFRYLDFASLPQTQIYCFEIFPQYRERFLDRLKDYGLLDNSKEYLHLSYPELRELLDRQMAITNEEMKLMFEMTQGNKCIDQNRWWQENYITKSEQDYRFSHTDLAYNRKRLQIEDAQIILEELKKYEKEHPNTKTYPERLLWITDVVLARIREIWEPSSNYLNEWSKVSRNGGIERQILHDFESETETSIDLQIRNNAPISCGKYRPNSNDEIPNKDYFKPQYVHPRKESSKLKFWELPNPDLS